VCNCNSIVTPLDTHTHTLYIHDSSLCCVGRKFVVAAPETIWGSGINVLECQSEVVKSGLTFKCNGKLKTHGFSDPRRIFGMSDVIWCIGRRYQCTICKAQTNSLEPDIIKQYPIFAQSQLDYVFTHRYGVTQDVLSHLEDAALSESFEGFAAMLNSMHHRRFDKYRAMYYLLVQEVAPPYRHGTHALLFVVSVIAVPLLYHCCTIVVPLLYHCCTTVVPLLYHCCTIAVPLLYHCCTTVVPLPYHYTTLTLCWLCRHNSNKPMKASWHKQH
jgi:hypothetical protein